MEGDNNVGGSDEILGLSRSDVLLSPTTSGEEDGGNPTCWLVNSFVEIYDVDLIIYELGNGLSFHWFSCFGHC